MKKTLFFFAICIFNSFVYSQCAFSDLMVNFWKCIEGQRINEQVLREFLYKVVQDDMDHFDKVMKAEIKSYGALGRAMISFKKHKKEFLARLQECKGINVAVSTLEFFIARGLVELNELKSFIEKPKQNLPEFKSVDIQKINIQQMIIFWTLVKDGVISEENLRAFLLHNVRTNSDAFDKFIHKQFDEYGISFMKKTLISMFKKGYIEQIQKQEGMEMAVSFMHMLSYGDVVTKTLLGGYLSCILEEKIETLQDEKNKADKERYEGYLKSISE